MNIGRRFGQSSAVLAVAVLAVAVAAALLLGPELAYAAPSDVGRNIGRELRSWSSALLLAVAGLVAIPVLARRDVSGGLVLAGLVILVGGFVYAAPVVVAVIKGMWRSVA